jgi:hypothetical protein
LGRGGGGETEVGLDSAGWGVNIAANGDGEQLGFGGGERGGDVA